MSSSRVLPRALVTVLSALLAVLGGAVLSPATAEPVEDYADYQPQTRCAPAAKPGTEVLGRWLVRRYGGGFGPISRACAGDSVSEHKEGRAFDWTLDATRRTDRRTARAFLRDAFADGAGNTDVKARRMGIMYVIWDDRMYSAWDQFQPEDYLSSGCRTVRKCSKTLRHRDHMHISLNRAGGRGDTSWFEGRIAD